MMNKNIIELKKEKKILNQPESKSRLNIRLLVKIRIRPRVVVGP